MRSIDVINIKFVDISLSSLSGFCEDRGTKAEYEIKDWWKQTGFWKSRLARFGLHFGSNLERHRVSKDNFQDISVEALAGFLYWRVSWQLAKCLSSVNVVLQEETSYIRSCFPLNFIPINTA